MWSVHTIPDPYDNPVAFTPDPYDDFTKGQNRASNFAQLSAIVFHAQLKAPHTEIVFRSRR